MVVVESDLSGGVTWRRGGVVSRGGHVLTCRSGGGKGWWWWWKGVSDRSGMWTGGGSGW